MIGYLRPYELFLRILWQKIVLGYPQIIEYFRLPGIMAAAHGLWGAAIFMHARSEQ